MQKKACVLGYLSHFEAYVGMNCVPFGKIARRWYVIFRSDPDPLVASFGCSSTWLNSKKTQHCKHIDWGLRFFFGLGFRVHGSGFRVWGLGVGVQGLGFREESSWKLRVDLSQSQLAHPLRAGALCDGQSGSHSVCRTLNP